jgi:hypothetical protein
MSEEKFWGFASGASDEFEYGRKVLNDTIFDTLMKLPFVKIELTQESELIFNELKSLDPRGLDSSERHK